MAERRVRVIGMGTGAPGQLSGEAIEALTSVAYVIAADKGDGDPLLGVRRRLCERYGVDLVVVRDPERDRDDPADYAGAVRDWHVARVDTYAEVLADRPGDAAFLVWGDPAFYDSTLRVVEDLAARLRLACDVIPGISAPQLLAARHRIVLHGIGQPILVTTGRRLADAVIAGHDNIVVMLDGRLACLELDLDGWWIWWGANLGSDHEALVAGRLADVADEVARARDAVKASAGWVMDTYLLRRVEAREVPSGA
ncbi:MAG: hypothetical protein JWQ32_1368 [Marmoricola sp.]|nr:hypothetical protein [Marmoricola sp.]